MRMKDYDKQYRIKQALVRLILREGFSGASISKIAKEAGVSPATIYVYYDSKEDMLAEIFREYSDQSYKYLMRRVRPEMGGAELIDALVRGYFSYTVEHEEIFSFVEQCSCCPTLAEEVSVDDCCCEIFSLIHEYQKRGEVRPYSDPNIAAMLFPPVRSLAMRHRSLDAETDTRLTELVRMLQTLLLYGG